MEREFIGIDLGTTSFKGAVLNLDRGGRGLGRVRRVPAPHCIGGLAPTRWELDPGAVLTSATALLRDLLQSAPGAAGLVMCSQMHSVVLTDEKGQARSNVITWKDERTSEALSPSGGTIFDQLRELVSPSQRGEIGGELRNGVPIGTLFALAREGSLPPGCFATALPDFVIANLCATMPVTEATNAAAHGLYHLDRRDWHTELISRLGFDGLKWPEIRPFGERIGWIEIDGKRLACFTPVGDQQCALLGAGLGERELSLNISTGSQVSLLGRERPRAEGEGEGDFLIRPFFDNRWLKTIVSVPAGRPLQMLVDLLTEMGSSERDPWEYIQAAVEGVSETDLEVDLSFFPSLTGRRGRIANAHEGNLSVGHLFVAAFRAMASNYSRCAGTLAPKMEWDRVVFSGGLAQRFARLRREILAALGEPAARLCDSEEDTLHGLLALALVCDGRAASVEEAGRIPSRYR